MTLNSGERQVAPTIDGIRRDHVARYEWAAKLIPAKSVIVDFSCGIGYGTRLLSNAGNFVNGYDIDKETIVYARQNYGNSKTRFTVLDATNPHDIGKPGVAVCFETIEHIKDPRILLKKFRETASLLIASVPNEDVMPYEFEPGKVYAFHHRHYTKDQFDQLLTECGWKVNGWYGQEGQESEVEKVVNGRTLIAVCSANSEWVEPPAVENPITAPSPDRKHIAILGLGPSVSEYLELTKRDGGRRVRFDETWSINALGGVFASDLVFHMDDIRIQEIRAQAHPDTNIAAMVRWIKTSTVAVVTSRAHPDYPALVEFPLEEVLNHLGHDYFNSTAAYAVAFAIHVGATELSVFGMDFTYPNVHDAEKGRACVEFWLGQAHARGIKINIPKCSTLMDSMYPRTSRLYGYDTLDVNFNIQPDGHLKLEVKPRPNLPTAEEIEKNYDHSAPIAKQHLSTKE